MDEETRQKALLALFNNLNLFYADLNRLILEYEKEVPWLGNKIQEIEVDCCWTLGTDQKYLYVGILGNCVTRYTMDTLQLVDKFELTGDCSGLDISGNELYVYDNGAYALKIFNITTKDLIRQWNTPEIVDGIKLYGGNLYCTSSNLIYVYNLSGTLIKQFGKGGSGNGEFSTPGGIDVDDTFIYIADHSNHRVQVFYLENCTYSHQWGGSATGNGQFQNPWTIRLYDGLVYVGDHTCIQVFTKDGQFLCRFDKTEFSLVRGMSIVGNRLYVSDHGTNRVVVLQ